jgi:hypothetical protein
MKFRFKMFRWHLGVSTVVLSVVLGGFYLGWYHWPGWYLAVVTPVVIVMAGVDLALGPLLTLIIANPGKARHTLARDISIIAAVQLFALGYGSVQLWNGRPLYYVFSGGILQLVQSYDLDPQDASLAHAKRSEFAPHWYSLPRWAFAPEPAIGAPASAAASTVPPDYSTMPSYFRPWEAGLVELRTKLQPLDASGYFIFNEKSALTARMRKAGLRPEEHNTIAMTGRGRPVLVVFDWSTLKIQAIFRPD